METGASLLVLGGTVVAMDESLTVIEGGGIAIDGTRIVAVGPDEEIEAAFRRQGTEVIDAGGRLVLPGLVNTHTHAADILFRGLVEDLPLEPWLERLWRVEREHVSPGSVAAGSRLAQAEMIRGGTTTALDMFFFPEEAVAVARRTGFRLATGPFFFDSPDVDGIEARERAPRARELLEELRDDALLVPCLLAHSTYTVAPSLLEAGRDLAAEFGALFSTHVAETRAEVETVQRMHGNSPPRHLDRLGVLEMPTVLAHCVHLTRDEIELLAERDSAVAHCPMSNLKLGSGVAPIPSLRGAGVRTTLGTDGPVSSNDLDLWATLRLGAVLHKGVGGDPRLMPAREVFAQATIEGARALGLGDRIGSIEKGKEADLVIVDLDRPHLVPLHD
ncbi:MAG TPA: amidohydrolase, partial [Gemmatimonadota bacterium]|nr:amidohydrolase [Gemmatimonadota bacterium]